MTYLERTRIDVEATIAAHREDGDGWCAGEHDERTRYPCQVRLWMEDLAERQRRRWPGGPPETST